MPPLRLDQCNQEILGSALFAPQTTLQGVEKYPTLGSKAAALMYALAKSQACPDGNKRVALILTVEFLALNGATLSVDQDQFADMILEVAEADAAARDDVVQGLIQALDALIVPLPPEDA